MKPNLYENVFSKNEYVLRETTFRSLAVSNLRFKTETLVVEIRFQNFLFLNQQIERKCRRPCADFTTFLFLKHQQKRFDRLKFARFEFGTKLLHESRKSNPKDPEKYPRKTCTIARSDGNRARAILCLPCPKTRRGRLPDGTRKPRRRPQRVVPDVRSESET